MIDGTGHPAHKANVRVTGDRITAIGNLRPRHGEEVIEARGLVLAPGFIDLHNHSSNPDRDLDAVSQISQGITTILVGQDGSSGLPISDYLKHRRETPASLNMLTLVGHASVRSRVMQQDYKRAARPEEIKQMADLVEQAMSEGAVGLSTGLEYEFGSYSTTEEVIALARAAGKHGGIYVSHIRDESDHSSDSIREAIRIGEEGHLPVQISHIKLGSVAVWGKSVESVKLVEAAHKRGVDVTADCYPYDAWSSTITVLVLNKQYDDPISVGKGLADVGGPANVTITRCSAHQDYEGKTLEQIAAELGITPVAAYSKIVKDGGAGVVCKAMIDDDIKRFYQQPWVMVASDGGIGMKHPRAAGTFPRVLGEFVRERHWLTLPEAVHKMTAAPAARLKLADRGTIKKGAFADLVLFDPARVKDRATFKDPAALAVGIEKVFVNGQLVWSDAKATGVHPGKVLEPRHK